MTSASLASPIPSAETSTSALERLLHRALVALGVSSTAIDLHRALEEAQATLGGRAGTLALASLALGRLGVAARPGTAPLADALEGVGAMRPLLVVLPDGSGALVWDRQGERVRVAADDPSMPEWMSAAQLVAMAAGGDYAFVDPAMPLARPDAEDPHHHHPPPLARLVGWLRAERHDLAAIALYAVFVGLFTLTLPVAAQALVSTIALGTLLQPLVVLTVLLVGALAFSASLRAAQTYVVEILQRRIFVRVVADFAHRLPRVPRDALDGRDAPELVNRFFDTFTMQKSAATLLLGGLEITLTVLVGMLVLAFYHPVLLAFDVVLVLVIAGIVVILGRRGTQTAIAESERKYATAAWLEELVRHETPFKTGGGAAFAELRAQALAQDYLARREEHFAVVFRQTLAVLAMQTLANAAVLGIGGFLVIDRQLSLGQLVAAELIVTVVVASLAKIGKYLETYYDLLAAMDKLGHVSDLPTERVDGHAGDGIGAQGRPRLRLEDVHAGYAGRPDRLRGVSLELDGDDVLAIVGPSGAGKSLLADVLVGLREPRVGRVLLDGHDLREVALESLREKVALVRDEIVAGTVLDNVRLGRSVDERAARLALAQVGLLETMESLPQGLRTELTHRGEPLSRGERARLAVARAIAGAPRLLVIDGTLDTLDPPTRRSVLASLLGPDRPWTLVLITSHPDVIDHATTTCRLQHGDAVMEGASS